MDNIEKLAFTGITVFGVGILVATTRGVNKHIKMG